MSASNALAALGAILKESSAWFRRADKAMRVFLRGAFTKFDGSSFAGVLEATQVTSVETSTVSI